MNTLLEEKRVRKIKFRAWDKEGKIMYYKIHSLYFDEYECNLVDGERKGGLCDTLHFANIELMQFTGLVDKCGVEIYEGDIVKDKFDDNGIIEWNEKWACFQSRLINDNYQIQPLATIELQHTEFYNWEVIGNIYKNPELIE